MLSDKASDFVTACYEENFVQPFDWTNWSNEHKPELNLEGFIEEADLLTIVKLLTSHIRGDRFCEGHLLSVMGDGTILKILNRLKEIDFEPGTPLK